MSDGIKLNPLSEKHKAFLSEYLKDFNAKRSYLVTYNCSESTADTKGSALVGNVRFKPHLEKALKEREAATKVDSTYVVEYVKGAAELDLSEFAIIGSKGVSLKDFKKIPKELRRYITEIHSSETKMGKLVVNFKVFSKEKALDMLAKHTGATRERVEVSGEITVNSITDLVKKHS